MPHAVNLITTLAAGFGLALLFGFIAARLGLPALVGYLVAGVAIGPATPGFVADGSIAAQLAEIGVMLLMFGVGLHFSLDDLKSVRGVALPGAVVQMAVATAMGFGLGQLWDWPVGDSLVFGISLSVASTVVLVKALEAQHQADSANGRIAVGWLVVEDLAMVLVLVLLPALAPLLGGSAGEASASGEPEGLLSALLRTLAGVVAFVVFMLVVDGGSFPSCSGTSRARARASSSRCAWWLRRWALPMPRQRSLACRLHWGRFSRAWCCANRNSASGRRSRPSPCKTPLRCCSLYRWACCLTPVC